VYIIEAAHNPEVAGSNPAPATSKVGNGAFLRTESAMRYGSCERRCHIREVEALPLQATCHRVMRLTLMAAALAAALTLMLPMSGAASAHMSALPARIAYGRAPTAAPRVTSETETSGGVRATVSYVLLPKRSRYYVRLVVERDRRQIYDERVPSVSRPGAGNQPIGVWRTQGLRSARTITLRDLDGDGEPEILLEFWYGGAHCCFWTRIYRWTRAAAAMSTPRTFGGTSTIASPTSTVWGGWNSSRPTTGSRTRSRALPARASRSRSGTTAEAVS
jgi:hypothetical protein